MTTFNNNNKHWFGVVSLFPEMFHALQCGVFGRAVKSKKIQLEFFNPRDFVTEGYKSVDDYPYGGGPGMLMKLEPLKLAINKAKSHAQHSPLVIYLSPQGKLFKTQDAQDLAQESNLILVCGRYEGVDERFIAQEVDAEYSIGDYILTGGELPSMVVLDAISRFIPGVLGDYDSVKQDSFMNQKLKYPQYTRPPNFNGMEVPQVLRNGNHQAIADWRIKNALGQTWLKRPELLKEGFLTPHEQNLLDQFISEFLQLRNIENS